MKPVKDVIEYRKYIATKKSSGDSEFNLISAASKIDKELNDNCSDLFKFLSNLDEYQKIELLRAVIVNDKAENLSSKVSDILTEKYKLPKVNLENIIAMNSKHDATQWLNDLPTKLAVALMHNSKGERLDNFSYARIIKGAVSKIPDTTISMPVKRNILRNITMKFDAVVIDNTQPYKLIKQDTTTINSAFRKQLNDKFLAVVVDCSKETTQPPLNQANNLISPSEFDALSKNTIKLSTAEYIITAIGVLKNISGVSAIADDKIKQIIQSYLAADFLKATTLIQDICKSSADKLNLLSPDLSDKLIKLQNDLKLETYYVDYTESVELLNKSKSTGTISLSEFKALENNIKIDKSEYIMIAVGVLKKISQDNADMAGIDSKLKLIRNNYLTTDFEKANELIKDICTEYSDKLNSKSPKLSERLVNLQDNCEEVDLQKNYTRRFFENRVGAQYLGTELKLDSINRITKHFTPNNFQIASDAKQAILQFVNDKMVDPNAGEKDMISIANRMNEFQKSSDLFTKRGRKMRPGIMNVEKELENEKKIENVKDKDIPLEMFSRNKGAMKSLQPNYRDELSESDIRNAMPDIHTYVKQSGSYVEENKRSAYVASISGHTFFFIALLEKYMKDNKDSPTLSDDINNFLHGLAATYVSMGFHSLLEVSDVLKTPKIQDTLKEYNIKYDPSFSENILEQAFNDSQAYTAQLLLRTAVQQELKTKTDIFALLSEGNFEGVKSLITKGIDPNQKDDKSNTPLHVIALSDALTTQQKCALADLLVKNGANKNAVNDEKRTPMAEAVYKDEIDNDVVVKLLNDKSDISENINVFAYAMLMDKLNLATNLLNTNQFDPNLLVQSWGESFTPLTKSIGESDLEFLKALLEHKDTDVNKKDANENIPLLMAIEKDNVDIVKALLSHPKIDLTLKNNEGKNAIQIAEQKNNIEVLKVLDIARIKHANAHDSFKIISHDIQHREQNVPQDKLIEPKHQEQQPTLSIQKQTSESSVSKEKAPNTNNDDIGRQYSRPR